MQARSVSIKPTARIRRASCLAVHWEDRELVIQNALTGKCTTTSPELLVVLDGLGKATPARLVLRRLAMLPDAAQLLDALIQQDVLLVAGSALESKDQQVAAKWAWGMPARLFHFTTQAVPYETDLEAQRNSLIQHAKTTPAPAPYKEYSGKRIALAGTFRAKGDFWQTLLQRRTRRRFQNRPIAAEDLGRLLLWTWGKTQEIDNAQIGTYVLKTSPSGGARHPVEVYVLAQRVSGIAPGIYHYSVQHHALEFVAKAPTRKRIVELMAGQKWMADAAAVFFMTAVVGRSMWKYKHDHAYRVLLLDSGHLAQTFCLVATRLGLAAFTSSAKSDVEIERTLGLDGVEEISLYVTATGLPAQERSDARRAASGARP